MTEAVTEAVETRFKRTRTCVVSLEHLVAIMLQTDRPKDRTRMTHLLDEAKVDGRKLSAILKRHGLTDKWKQFKQRHYGN